MSEAVEFITIIRPSFMRLCKDACRAAAFNHILFRLAGKCKDQPKEKIQTGEITWYAKNEQITSEMSNAWGVCKVRKEVNELIDMGLIGRSKNPKWGVDRTKHFSFGTEQCNTFLQLCQENGICFVHLDLCDEVKHLIYSSNANDKSIKCICAIHQMQAINLSNANDKSIRAIPIEDNKDNNNREDTYVNANALTRTPSQETSSENENNSHHDIPSVDTSHQASTDIPIATPTPQTELIGVATRNTDSLPEVTQAAAPPQKLAKNTSKRGSKRKQDLEAIAPLPPPEKPSIDAPWNVLTCMALADYYRGYTLTNGSYGKALAEATKLIQRGKTYRQVDATYRYMTGTEKKEDGSGLFDEYWHDKTVDIWHVNTHIDAKLKEIREKRNPTPTSTASPSLAQSISATRNLDKEMAEMEARYSRKRAQ